MNRPISALLLILAALAAGSSAAFAQSDSSRLADLTLEQLTNIEVTSMGKRLQRVSDVAGAVYVIRAEEIRRSGASTLTEALRLAPNLIVARADSSQYAVTARSGADILSNKMLVLIDGRTVYSPLFSGVFWEAQDLVMEDIDRIEVLGGSGGTLYGSNAFNGIINIITRSAAETQGLLLSIGGGNTQRIASARFGHTTEGGAAYKLYAKRTRLDATAQAGGASAQDAAGRSIAGFRADYAVGTNHYTLQGDMSEHQADEPAQKRRYTNVNLLGRRTRELAGGGREQIQFYLDRSMRDRTGAIRDTMDTWDLDYQRESRPALGHTLLWGAGARQHDDSAFNYNPALSALVPSERRLRLWNVYAQDEVAIGPALKLTGGLKLENNSYTGLEYLPNFRLAWQASPSSLVWSAISRTVRTPSRIDREVSSRPLVGGPNFVSEVARVYEIGYRANLQPGATVVATLFHHDFERLRSLDLTTGGVTFNNNYSGKLTGVSTWGDWLVSPGWRLRGSYVVQRATYSARAGTAPLLGAGSLGNDPGHRATLSSSWDLGRGMEFDVAIRRMGALPGPAVPAYTAVDARWGWTARADLELSVTLRNLFDPAHPEWTSAALRSEIPRSIFFQAIWRR